MGLTTSPSNLKKQSAHDLLVDMDESSSQGLKILATFVPKNRRIVFSSDEDSDDEMENEDSDEAMEKEDSDDGSGQVDSAEMSKNMNAAVCEVPGQNVGKSANILAPLEVKNHGSSLSDGSFSSPSISKTLGSDDSDDCVENGAVTSQKALENNTQLFVDGNARSVEANNDTLGPKADVLVKNKGDKESAHKVFVKLPQRSTAAENSKLTYSRVLAGNRKATEGFQLRYIEPNEDGSVRLESSDVQDITTKFGYALIGYIAGRFPGKQGIDLMCSSWKAKPKIHFHNSGWLVFRFENEDDRSSILNGGPYFVWGRQLLLKNMPEFFEFGKHEFKQVPTWINVHNLPLECWTPEALSKAMSLVGKPIQTDKLTSTFERISFARILVEVDASKKLKEEIEFTMPCGKVHKQRIVYENKPLYCGKCESIGHVMEKCSQSAEGNNIGKHGSSVIAGKNTKNAARTPTVDTRNQQVNIPGTSRSAPSKQGTGASNFAATTQFSAAPKTSDAIGKKRAANTTGLELISAANEAPLETITEAPSQANGGGGTSVGQPRVTAENAQEQAPNPQSNVPEAQPNGTTDAHAKVPFYDPNVALGNNVWARRLRAMAAGQKVNEGPICKAGNVANVQPGIGRELTREQPGNDDLQGTNNTFEQSLTKGTKGRNVKKSKDGRKKEPPDSKG